MKSLQYIEIDTPAFDAAASPSLATWRFAVPTEYLPRDIDAIPSITGISFSPAVISLGENLGQRATLTITFKDHRHIMNLTGSPNDSFDQGTFWGKWRGRYGTRLRARAVRWIQGLEGDALADMETRHFIVESTSGPTPDGTYTIVAQDVLKLADGDRALAPRPTDAFLLANITNAETAFSVGPTGAGDFYFPTSGYINIGGKEVCSFTRSGDGFAVTRATTIPGFSFETEVVAHEAGSRIQLCLAYTADAASDIVYDLFVNYANISANYIALATWQLEDATYLQTVYTTLITEPTAVNKLVSELVQQAALAIWWDNLNALLRFQVIRAIATTAEDFTEDNTLQGSLKTQDQANTRLSEVLMYFALRNPLKPIDQKDNYRSALLTIDLNAETDYGGVANKTIFSRWIAFGGRTVAQRVNNIILGRFVDPPRRFNFEVWRHGPETVVDGGGYEITWTNNQDELGNPVLAPIQVTRVTPLPDKYQIEAEEMLVTVQDPADLQNRIITIDSDINNINLLTLHNNIYPAIIVGESPTVSVTFIISANVIVGSTSTANPACDVGTWPADITPLLRVIGRIQGCGGAGGDISVNPDLAEAGQPGGTALYTRDALNLDVDEGEIWGGGGGGGPGSEGNAGSHDQGGGGGGAGRVGGTGGIATGGTGALVNGAPGTSEAGGLGGNIGSGSWGGGGSGPFSGDGGGPGLNGGDGHFKSGGGPFPGFNPEAPGGVAGDAIDGISFITVVQGPGDIRGDQVN